MMNKESPCAACTRVKFPASCENKYCKEWEAWFVERWNQIYGFYQKYIQTQEKGAEE